MLILPKHLQYPEKNPIWSMRTPNEAYDQEPGYQELVDFFVAKHGVKRSSFFEVRCTGSKIYTNDEWWYDDPFWVDKVFWVFQKPLIFRPPGEGMWQGWVLEPLEHMRIHQVHREAEGKTPYAPDQLFILPCDAGQVCWTETSGGYSDHIQHRPDFTPSQQELDRAHRIDEEAKRILNEAYEIPMDSEMFKDDERAYKTK